MSTTTVFQTIAWSYTVTHACTHSILLSDVMKMMLVDDDDVIGGDVGCDVLEDYSSTLYAIQVHLPEHFHANLAELKPIYIDRLIVANCINCC